MLRIDRAVVDQLARAGSAADVVDLVQDAVRLEFATIPPYLTAMMSLKPNQNRDIWWAIHDVVVDEMLHMLIGCNLLNALGARPALDAENFLPEYPGPLPLGIGSGLVVGLEPFSIPLLENRTLSSTILALPDPVLPGDPARQVVAPNWYPAERLFSILTTADAARGIELIIEEGEGTSVSPIDPDGDVAHYYRFAAIVKDHRLVRDDSAPNGFSYTGDPYSFEASGVWPLTPNQRPSDLDSDSEAWRRVNQFQVTFTRLLTALQRCVDGNPGHLDAAMGIMFELKLAGQKLAALPAVKNGAPTGLNAGPVFARALINE